MSCNSHNLNLLASDAASENSVIKVSFGSVQEIYKHNIFAGSSHRLNILLKRVHITLKPLSKTRWEARIESLKVVKFHLL